VHERGQNCSGTPRTEEPSSLLVFNNLHQETT
jgi:hypothetical protein